MSSQHVLHRFIDVFTVICLMQKHEKHWKALNCPLCSWPKHFALMHFFCFPSLNNWRDVVCFSPNCQLHNKIASHSLWTKLSLYWVLMWDRSLSAGKESNVWAELWIKLLDYGQPRTIWSKQQRPDFAVYWSRSLLVSTGVYLHILLGSFLPCASLGYMSSNPLIDNLSILSPPWLCVATNGKFLFEQRCVTAGNQKGGEKRTENGKNCRQAKTSQQKVDAVQIPRRTLRKITEKLRTFPGE